MSTSSITLPHTYITLHSVCDLLYMSIGSFTGAPIPACRAEFAHFLKDGSVLCLLEVIGFDAGFEVLLGELFYGFGDLNGGGGLT